MFTFYFLQVCPYFTKSILQVYFRVELTAFLLVRFSAEKGSHLQDHTQVLKTAEPFPAET